VKTVIYARVSTRDQNPENQLVQLKEYVENNKDMKLFGIYKDKISGVKDTRPELDKLMSDARQHKFNHVVIWKVDRLGRSPLHMFHNILSTPINHCWGVIDKSFIKRTIQYL